MVEWICLHLIYSHLASAQTHSSRSFPRSMPSSKDYAEVLNDEEFLFGVAQKAVNIYLKYLWCANLDFRPPHCPFDYGIIEAVNLNSGSEHRWTFAHVEDYREWVRLAEVAAEAKGFKGLRALSEWELWKWAEIQAEEQKRL